MLLDNRGAMLQGGESGPVLIPSKPDESLLIDALRYGDIAMPPEAPLPDTVINDFVDWIKRGAPRSANRGNRRP
ncbi:MAG: c-type cytochrome domain-containing protein [Pirellulaceae bacterium]